MHHAVQPILREILEEGVALPFATLVLRLRRRGAAVTEPVLERMLRAEDSGVRLLDPWRGPHAALARLISTPEVHGAEGLWVVPEDGAIPPLGEAAPGETRGVFRALRCLGRELDERSPRDIARWLGLVEEARRLRRPAA